MTPREAVPRFCLVPAVYVVLRRHGGQGREVLLQFRRGTGFMDEHWACGAAGHVEASESVFSAAVREAAEELDIRIRPEDLVPLTVVHRRHEDDDPVNQRVDVFFAVDRWDGEPRTVERHKSADLRWFPLEALPDRVVPHERRVLDGLARGELQLISSVGFDEAP